MLGLTGTGGAGKSSVTDELLNRFLAGFPQMRIAVVSVDPSRQHSATNRVLKDCIALLKGIGYDLVIVETTGIGQSDSEIVDLVDFPVYVMTSYYGAPSQLEKIDMLDFAELVVLNKYDRRGAEDALRDVRKQWRRNRVAFQLEDAAVPVYPTIASKFNDPGISWMFVNLCRLLRAKLGLDASDPAAETTDAAHRAAPSPHCDFQPQLDTTLKEPRATVLIPGAQVRYLAELAEQGRALNAGIQRQAEAANRAQAFWQSL